MPEERSYLVLLLVELVANGITGGLDAGSDVCVAVLGDLCESSVSLLANEEVRAKVRSVRLLVSFEAWDPAPWTVSEM